MPSVDVAARLAAAQEMVAKGNVAEARASVDALLQQTPGLVAVWLAAGMLAHADRAPLDAVRYLRRAAAMAPKNVRVLDALAQALVDAAQLPDALRVFEQALALDGARADGWLRYAWACNAAHDHARADLACQRLVALAPRAPSTWNILATLAVNRNEWTKAELLLTEWLAVEPTSIGALSMMGETLSRMRRFDEAEAVFAQAEARANPTDIVLWVRLGSHRLRYGADAEARALFAAVVEARPDWGLALGNLGVAELRLGQFDAAIDCFQQAIEREPGSASHHWNLSHALLQSGRLRDGFAVHEQRAERFGRPEWWADRWRGEALPPGTPVLVEPRQGLGDTLQFARFLAAAAVRGPKLLVRAPERIHALLACVRGVQGVVKENEAIPLAAMRRVELLSLPYLLHVDNEADLSASVPYIVAEPARRERIRERLGTTGFRVGIVWQGNPNYSGDHLRSPALSHFVSLARLPNIRLFSLQQVHGLEQLQTLPSDVYIDPLHAELDQDVPFLDTAAAMAELDLVLTSDTSTAHLAGALGVEAWVVLPFAPDWRWPREGDRTPWYPTMRLFRQTVSGDWPGVFAAVEAALRERLRAHQGSSGHHGER